MTADRPQLAKLMAALTHGDVVIIPAVDRLSRDATDLLVIARDMQRAGGSVNIRCTKGLSWRHASKGSLARLYCVDRWALDIPAASSHTAKILRLSEDLPIIVEIIDSEQNITAFLPLLDKMLTGGLVSLEEVRILRYGPDQNEPGPSLG
jgi:uncharacterized protein DUF190/resolvase-like protein